KVGPSARPASTDSRTPVVSQYERTRAWTASAEGTSEDSSPAVMGGRDGPGKDKGERGGADYRQRPYGRALRDSNPTRLEGWRRTIVPSYSVMWASRPSVIFGERANCTSTPSSST